MVFLGRLTPGNESDKKELPGKKFICNNNKDKEGGSHSPPRTTEFCRRQTKEGEGDVKDDGNNEHVNGRVRGLRQADTRDR